MHRLGAGVVKYGMHLRLGGAPFILSMGVQEKDWEDLCKETACLPVVSSYVV